MQEYHKIVLLRCGYKNYEPGREPSVAEGMPAIVRLWHFLTSFELIPLFYEVSLLFPLRLTFPLISPFAFCLYAEKRFATHQF